jgi:hypothetical protein
MTSEMEEWCPIVGYEERYEVSSQGRVRSIDCSFVTKAGVKRFHRGRILVQAFDDHGRPVVYLSVNKDKRTERVHKLVANAFLGPQPSGTVVCHKNDVNTDNRKDNLSYGTQSDNIKQRDDRGRTALGGGTHGRAKLTPDEVREIRSLKPFLSYQKLAAKFAVSHTTIEQLIKGRAWGHVK